MRRCPRSTVATEILSVRDSAEVLLSITHTAHRLLDADIAGVFLREGEDMVMQSCVGHRRIETARLRMTRGQGLAGRVLQTGEPVQVDDYVHAQVISDDFIPLAQLELVRSALGAPLTVAARPSACSRCGGAGGRCSPPTRCAGWWRWRAWSRSRSRTPGSTTPRSPACGTSRRRTRRWSGRWTRCASRR